VPRPAPHRAQERDTRIDSLRGIAIVLMIAGHVIGGMHVAASSGWTFSYALFADLRMPLFTALSGFVYGPRPVSSLPAYGPFVWKKTRRLLVPLVTVGSLFIVLQSLVPGTNSDVALSEIWRLYVFGMGHFWFLQAIFLIFLVVGLADAAGWLQFRGAGPWLLAFAALAAVCIRVPLQWDIFSVSRAIYLLPFFMAGYLLSQGALDRAASVKKLMPCVALILLTVRGNVVSGLIVLPQAVDSALGVTLGLTGVASLILWRDYIRWKPLAWLGVFSFGIYLFHIFGSASARMLLAGLGVEKVKSRLVV